jgi:hypothetical protein
MAATEFKRVSGLARVALTNAVRSQVFLEEAVCHFAGHCGNAETD